MSKLSLRPPLKKAQEVLSSAVLQPRTDETQSPQLKQPRRALRRWVWVVVVVGSVVVGGRLLFFEVDSSPLQWPLKAREWTGFGESYDNNVSVVKEEGTEADGKTTKQINKTTTTETRLQPAKTLWDWASLLLAPATLAGLGFLFQFSQERSKREQEKAEKERSEAQAKAEKERNEAQAKAEKERNEAQAKADKERVADQQRETALQDYLDYLSALLVDKQLKQFLPPLPTPNEAPTFQDEEAMAANTESSDVTEVSKAKPEAKIDSDAALDVVKAKTLALFRLFDQAEPKDMARKASVLAFLGDSGLLAPLDLDLRGSHWAKANLRRAQLSDADFTGADFRYADFSGADLRGANLTGANLNSADLSGADLRGADLRGANLTGANLTGANLTGAYLIEANLSGADFRGANLLGANLSGANLNSACLFRSNLRFADFSGAKLSGANLQEASLQNANLSFANLKFADFSGAGLSGADLSRADLSEAKLGGAYLGNAELRYVILLGADLSTAKELTQAQLEGDYPPFLCHVTLPSGFKVDPQRDCAKLPTVLRERYPKEFKDLEAAKAFVDRADTPKAPPPST